MQRGLSKRQETRAKARTEVAARDAMWLEQVAAAYRLGQQVQAERDRRSRAQ